MELTILIFIFVFGTIFTSFYTLVGMRVPNSESINGRSHCDQCDKTIPWYALIPIIGWFIVKGQCVHCHKAISIKYPLIELIGGLLFAISYFILKDNMVEYGITIVFISLMLIVSISDIHYQIVPDKVLFFFLPLLLVLRMIFPLTTWYYSLMGGLLGFGFMLFMAWYGKKRFKQDALGGGDIKLYFLIGLFLEIHLVFLSLFFASIIGLIFGKLYINKMQHMAFVPFIFMGSLLAYFIGPMLLDWYTGLF